MPLPPHSDAVARLMAGSLRPSGAAPEGAPALLGVGEPDFATPEPIVRAGMEALAAGWTHYGDLNGDPELRALAARLASESAGVGYGPEQVLVTNGATSAVSAAVSSVVSPGDRVVLLDPSYSLFSSAVLMAGGEPVYVPLDDTGHLDLQRISAALLGARALILVNPANPVGTVFTRAELEALADLTERHGTVVIADEVCDHFVFDHHVLTSALAVDTWRDRLIYCQSLSKTYAMTGWRVGYLIAPVALVDGVRMLHRSFLGAVNAAAQRAAIVALEGGEAFVKPMRESYQERRDYIVTRVNAMPELSARTPEGGFFVLARYDRDTPSLELVERLKDHGVVVRPGREFGPAGEFHLRISIASPNSMLTTGLDRIADYFRVSR
ncbi:pyridoxal phosphate-dependent aminotransferase [Streptomyces malaysiensis]|uniref:pyridoxal phosphate-dependent aminotransferase n=1 Tax=Streptomyces malaysiensis TaxID=92644 RepID=UPI002B2E0900|nr:aminotransferase class I/II-fold pyridoxal phosphate-dependent enzyme [Streptomyces malaysiensis]